MTGAFSMNKTDMTVLIRISHEKDKYMKLAEIEAETICNLEKENFKLNDALNLAEEKFRKERETNRNLENELRVKNVCFSCWYTFSALLF